MVRAQPSYLFHNEELHTNPPLLEGFQLFCIWSCFLPSRCRYPLVVFFAEIYSQTSQYRNRTILNLVSLLTQPVFSNNLAALKDGYGLPLPIFSALGRNLSNKNSALRRHFFIYSKALFVSESIYL